MTVLRYFICDSFVLLFVFEREIKVKVLKRTASLILVAAMLVCCFSGCGILKGDTAISYGDYEITEVMYKYWLAKYKTTFLYVYNNSVDTESFWKSEIEKGYTYEDFIMDYIKEYAKQVLVAMQLFDDYGMSFTSAQKNEVKDRINDLIESYGGKNVLNETLGEMGLNIQTLERIYYEEAKLETVNEYFFGTNGVLAVNDNDREAYYKENYYCAMWIYIYTEVKLMTDGNGNYFTDENGVYKFEELSETEKQEKQMRLEALKKDLAAGKDFKELREKYSEEGLDYHAAYPDGIILSANDYENYGVDMINVVQGLEEGDYAGFNNGYATVYVKRFPLKDYAKLTEAERKLMVDFEQYVRLSKSEEFFEDYEVSYVDSVIDRYDIKTIKGSKDTSI